MRASWDMQQNWRGQMLYQSKKVQHFTAKLGKKRVFEKKGTTKTVHERIKIIRN